MLIKGKPYTFSEENIERAPDTSGVYILYKHKQLIYIGKAKGGTETIRSRLQDHKDGKEGRSTQLADSYSREICSNPEKKESYLKAILQRMARCQFATMTLFRDDGQCEFTYGKRQKLAA